MSTSARQPLGREPGWRAWGRVLRLSLTATAAADVAAGLTLGAGGWPMGPAALLAIAGSLCVYHGGMALNDWADRAEDARSRPDRPIPSGRLSAGTVRAVAVSLLLVGPGLTALADPRAGLVLAAVALAASLYDLAGRGPWRGPLLLALCRAGNVTAGLVAGAATEGAAPGRGWWALPLVYGAYVGMLSVLGRREDDLEREPGRLPARILHLSTLCLVAAPLSGAAAVGAATEPTVWLAAGLALAIWAALGLQRAAARTEAWTREGVTAAMGMLLRRMLIVTSSAVLASGVPGAPVVSGAILAGYVVSHRLRRIFPPS